MRPFQAFRFWTRRAPFGERAVTAMAGIVVVTLLTWLVVPSCDSSNGGDVSSVRAARTAPTVPGQASNSTGPALGPADGGENRASGTSVARGSGAGRGPTSESSRGTAFSAAELGARGCVSPPGKAKGVNDGEVRVAIALVDIVGPAGNSLFDLPPPAEQRAYFEAVVNGINRGGGIACRRLAATYVNVNPADESQMMQVCRDIADQDLFAVLDTGPIASRPAVLACFGQRKVPYFGAYFITEVARQQFYPYLFSTYTKEQLYKNTAFGLRDLGFYDPAKGFRKLGFIYRDCEREAIGAFRVWIREAGVPDGKVVTYNVGCPAAFANETDLAQAVLTFRRAGVSHVTTANFVGDMARFTSHAEQQGFRPRYGLPEEALVSISSSTLRAPNADNMANALTITLSREGENNTPGMTPTAGSERCNAYRRAAGLAPVWQSHSIAGNACNQLWMLQAALSRGPELSPPALPIGLQRTRSIEFAYPQGPNDFTGRKTTTGGQFWRVGQFMPDCKCWRVVQKEFRRGF